MKVLHVITGLATGGAETMLWKLLSAMDRTKMSSAVLVLGGRGPLSARIESLGINVFHLGLRKSPSTWFSVWRAMGLMRRMKPDVVDGWMYHGNLFAACLWILCLGRLGLVWNIRQSFSSYRNEKPITALVIYLGARLSRLPDVILYNSEASQKQHEMLGYHSVHARRIPNGFDLNRFFPSAEESHRWRTTNGISERGFVIGLIARVHPMKDHDSFLEAARKFQNINPESEFVLAGNGAEAGSTAFAAKLSRFGLGLRVHLLGEQSDVLPIVRGLDVLTLSSSHGEGFPNVVGEAMACEVPCVVTDVGDSGDVVGDTGLVVPPGSPDALVEAWGKLLSYGSSGRRYLGKAARLRVAKNYSLESTTEAFTKVYYEAAGARNAQTEKVNYGQI